MSDVTPPNPFDAFGLGIPMPGLTGEEAIQAISLSQEELVRAQLAAQVRAIDSMQELHRAKGRRLNAKADMATAVASLINMTTVMVILVGLSIFAYFVRRVITG